MPALEGVLETSLYVEALDRSRAFYQSIFGFAEVFANERLCALEIAPRQILLLFVKGESAKLPVGAHDGSGRSHLAFAIAASELSVWEDFLHEKGVIIEEKRHWERGGWSLYFRDPDGHLLEVATPGVWLRVY